LYCVYKKGDLALIVVYNVTNEKFRVVTAFKSSKLVILIRSKLSKGFLGKDSMRVRYDKRHDILYIDVASARRHARLGH
jgi:hypothetical protein